MASINGTGKVVDDENLKQILCAHRALFLQAYSCMIHNYAEFHCQLIIL